MVRFSEEEIQSNISIPCQVTNGVKEDMVVLIADGGNLLNHYGICEGMLLIFDLGAKHMRGHLSCFLNKTPDERRPRYRVSDFPLKGYRRISGLTLLCGAMRCMYEQKKSLCYRKCRA